MSTIVVALSSQGISKSLTSMPVFQGSGVVSLSSMLSGLVGLLSGHGVSLSRGICICIGLSLANVSIFKRGSYAKSS
jgi:hypothetical protein